MDDVLLLSAALILLAASVSYAMDADAYRRIREYMDRSAYKDHGNCRIIDQWWADGRLYTTAICGYGIRVNDEDVSFNRFRDDIDAAMFARQWVASQKGVT